MSKQEWQWRDHSVDINLRDEWLEALNAMQVLELRSIWEGHPRDERVMNPCRHSRHIPGSPSLT